MDSDTKVAVLEQELSKVKKELSEREQDLSTYKNEIERLNMAVSKILMGLDGDLSLVRSIFKYLVPTQFPHISGFHFSTKFLSGMRFNGDYLDVFEQKDRFKFNLILSSSTGPSLTALLIAFLLKHGRDLGDGTAPSPVYFIDKVLEEIEAKKENPSEIQIACMLIDKKTYELTYKVHGTVACFLQDGETGGVVDFKELSTETVIKLKPYDRIVIASPGMVSAPDSKGNAFSTTPILKAMSSVPLTQSVHDLRNDIFHKLDQHLGGRRPMQDVSLIVVSVENNIIKLV
ncbi:MAG: PP2C family protein-serine/threonine phosphatase [Bdellovibrionales bacterium]